ncbi:MAG: HU family DNA-binding protein [Curvibacter sp.]|nr:HU family DNA-binding protein [Curvibacter sp.]
MNKTELIAKLALDTDLTRDQAQAALQSVINTITEQLQQGDAVNILGFGSFVVAERAARTARNPRTGEAIEIAAGKVPRFKPGKALKDALGA